MLTPRAKSPQPGKKKKKKKKKNLRGGGSNPRRCIKQDSEPNTLPTELFWPPQPGISFTGKEGTSLPPDTHRRSEHLLVVSQTHRWSEHCHLILTGGHPDTQVVRTLSLSEHLLVVSQTHTGGQNTVT